MTHQHPTSSGRATRPVVGQQASVSKADRKSRLTTLGLLEVLMWGGGASLLLGFWLWQRPASEPAPTPIATEWSAPAVASQPATPSPALAQLAEWQERLRSSAQQAATQHDAADPVSTGSSSAAASLETAISPAAAAPAVPPPVPDTASSSVDEDGLPGERSDAGSAAEPLRADAPNLDPPQRAELPGTAQGGMQVAAIDPAALQPAVQVASPPQAPSPDVSARLQEDVAPSTPGLQEDRIDAAKAVDTAPQDVAKAEPPSVIPAPAAHAVAADASPPAAVSAAPTERPAPAPALDAAAVASVPTQPSAPAPVLDAAALEGLVKRGEEMLARGDVAAARLFFRRAAEQGDSRGARGMARSFDREVLRKLRVVGIAANAEQAAHWYARAQAMQAVASAR